MPSLYDYDRFLEILFELEAALAVIGTTNCEDLRAETQLCACVFSLLRATSLFRATLLMLKLGLMDASDVMRRAYWEAWMLGYEFRIETARTHAARWHFEKNKHGEPDLTRIKAFEQSNGITTSTYGANYGGLSEVTHPSKSAAENSVMTVNAIHGNTAGIEEARRIITQEDLPAMMYLLVWTIFANWSGMIPLGIKPEEVPRSANFYSDYNRSISATAKGHCPKGP